jgi:hypothetical protein
MREHDKLNDHDFYFGIFAKNNQELGFGRMIQIIQYIWTDSLIEKNKMSLEAAKRGSGETNWILDRLEKLEEAVKVLRGGNRKVDAEAIESNQASLAAIVHGLICDTEQQVDKILGVKNDIT